MCTANVSTAQVYINEISACNVNKELDPNKDFSGWVELYNASSKSVRLHDLYFSDEEGQPLKYRLNKTRSVEPGGYAVIWLNDEVMNEKTGNSLDVDTDGGFLSIANSQGEIYDFLFYPEQLLNVSYGRVEDDTKSNSFAYLLTSTLAASNKGISASSELVETPFLSVQSGFYAKKVTVTIGCATSGAKIYYTTDNSDPSRSSTLYTGTPLNIEKTTVLRATACKEGCLDASIVSATYLINERKPGLPVVFIATDDKNLYSEDIGIYCVGSNEKSPNYEQDWTRFATIDFIDEERNLSFNQNIGLSINGRTSRTNDQKSLQLKARGRFGQKRFDYPVFRDKENRRYRSLLLRNDDGVPARVKDETVQSLARKYLPVISQAYEPVVVYLNGKYWGDYSLRERNNQENVYTNFAYKKEEIDLIDYAWQCKVGVGTKANYLAMADFIADNDMKEEANYQRVRELIDVDNFVYYMAIGNFLYKRSWPSNNNKLFRPKEEGGRWRWLFFNQDNTMDTGKGDLLEEQESTLQTSDLFAPKMIYYLLENPSFKELYINAQCLVIGSVYTPENMKNTAYQIWDRIKEEYEYSKARWDNLPKDNEKYIVTKMLDNHEGLYSTGYENLQNYFQLGTPYSLSIKSSHSRVQLFFNGLPIPCLPYDGKYFAGKKLKLTASLYDEGEKFAYWEITRGGKVTKETEVELEFEFAEATSIYAVYEPVGLSRRAGVYINEISATNAIFADEAYKYEDWFELYNSSAWPVDLTGYYVSDNKDDLRKFQIPEAVGNANIIPAHGYLILWCSKKPERGGHHTNFKLSRESASVYLSREINGELLLVDSVYYSEHTDYTSFGRYPDGGESCFIFDRPTFAAKNAASSYNQFAYADKYDLVVGLDSPKEYKFAGPNVYVDENRTNLCIDGANGEKYAIYNLQGLLIISGTVYDRIPIGQIPSGGYLLKIQSTQGMTVVKFLR